MYKTIIIDDEENVREVLKIHIGNLDGYEFAGEANGIQKGLKLIHEVDFDLLLLDIEMLDGTGFDLLDNFGEIDFNVIFVTSFDQYAIKAFKYNAIDYVLKPIDRLELYKALRKVESSSHVKLSGPQFNALKQSLKDPSKSKLSIASNKGFSVVDFDNIIWAGSDNSYTTFYLDNGNKIVSSKPIKYFEELFLGSSFCRIHRSIIVNTNHIKEYKSQDGGIVLLTDGTELQVSRKQRNHLKKFFEIN